MCQYYSDDIITLIVVIINYFADSNIFYMLKSPCLKGGVGGESEKESVCVCVRERERETERE